MPPAALRPVEITLLGLLAEGPQHPYQLEKAVRERDMRYWTDLSMSSIYKLLPSLQKRGLVRCVRESVEQGRVRKIFRITPAGRKRLQGAVLEWLSEPEHLKWRLDIAISNLAILPRARALKALDQYRAGLDKLIAGYGELEKYLLSAGCPLHRLALARRPIRLYQGERRWVGDYIAELQSAQETRP